MIDITDLYVAFGPKKVLDGITLSVKRGEVVALVGANGSGKTSLFRSIAGAVKPVSGRILVDGLPQVVGRLPVPVSYVSDRRIVWQTMTPRRILHKFAAIHGLPRKEGIARTDHVIAELQMEDYAEKRQDKLSTGQAAKFSVARMLIRPYPVILLDEPTAGLDFNAAGIVRRQLRKLATEGHAVFVTTHSVDEITNVVDRALILRDGRIVLSADAAEMERRKAELPSMIGDPE